MRPTAQEFRTQLNAYGAQAGRTFSLTAFLPADPAKISAGIEIAPLLSTLDFATIQGYDLTGPWNPVTGHASNLYPVAGSAFSVDLAIDTYLAGGAPAGKLVLGIPYYGKGWAGVSSTSNGLNQPSSGPAQKCAYIKANGLGGSMVWSLDGDTASGELTTAIHNGL